MVLISALDGLKQTVLAESSAIFVYDGFAAQAGSLPSQSDAAVPVYHVQTRSGSSAVLAGYLNGLTGKSSADVKPITVLATPSSVLDISNALSSLPEHTARPSVVVHVALAEPSLEVSVVTGEEATASLERQPNVGKFLAALPQTLKYDPVVLLSGGAHDGCRDILNAVKAVKTLSQQNKDVIHAFEAVSVARELFSEKQTASTNGNAMDGVEFSNSTGTGENAISAAIGGKPFFKAFIAEGVSKIVVLPSSLHSSNALAALPAVSKHVGIVIASVIRPWSAKQLLDAMPSAVDSVHVYTESAQPGSAALYYDVAYTMRTSKAHKKVAVKPLDASSTQTWDVKSWLNALLKVSGQDVNGSVALQSLLPQTSKLAIFWSADEGKTSDLAERVAAQFGNQADVVPRLLTEFDNYAGKDIGVKRSILLLSPSTDSSGEVALAALAQTAAPQLLFISGPSSLLTAYNPLEHINTATQVVFSASSWLPEEYSAKLSLPAKAALVASADINKIWTLDVAKVAADSGLIAADGLIEEAAFWHFYVGPETREQEAVATITQLLGTSPAGGEWSQDAFNRLAMNTRNALAHVLLPKEGEGQPPAAAEADTASSEAIAPLPTRLVSNGITSNKLKTFDEPQPSAEKDWHLAAKQLLFAEAYEASVDNNRPDLPEENYILEVTENRRLTPLDYDRNVFHMELSTAGTGLKYAVGEALGVHGHNDAQEVHDFINWFGLDADAVVTVPSREGVFTSREARTVFQTLQQNLDIFGKPGKSFYEALSKISPEREESRHLRFISSAEGSATFKKMSDVDTVTYVDVLKAFPGAASKLGLEGLLREVPLIKPRHYSIASSQNFVGESVHLLVVTVDWKTPSEQTRYGQCTRYLAGLKVGDKVTVSVKPSVMKLPPKDTQPIIMAGLGTGAAPFRAFIQERQYQREQGLEIGPMLYYFGSRYSSKEFLYGEEIKAWLEDGLLTHAGLAFSRDTKKKVYIQHKMQEDGKMLEELLKDGYFYLCGPTWPVPDVYEALTNALVENRGHKKEEAQAHIEELKEAERYILEVY